MEKVYIKGMLVRLTRRWDVYEAGAEVYLQRDPNRDGCVTIHPQPDVELSAVYLTHVNVSMLEPVIAQDTNSVG